jgi:hypothetical protein
LELDGDLPAWGIDSKPRCPAREPPGKQNGDLPRRRLSHRDRPVIGVDRRRNQGSQRGYVTVGGSERRGTRRSGSSRSSMGTAELNRSCGRPGAP